MATCRDALLMIGSMAAITAAISTAGVTPTLPPSPPRNMSDPYYTSFHFQPLKNWMNDPNGPFYDADTGLYHLFAQYNPHGARWGDMNWYHAVSKDMIHWAHLPVALTPDHDYDCGGEFSGSATLVNNVPVLSVSVACGKWVFMAIPANSKSSDPLMINWRKNGSMPGSNAPFSGPLFDAPSYSTGGFRDPTTGWQGADKVWRMATGCGDRKKGGACLFKSDNFVNWTAVGWLHHPQGAQNVAFWECPDFYPIPGTDKYVLKGSASGDWWSVGSYKEMPGMTADEFTPISYDIHDGSPQGLGLQKYDFGQFYASKAFYDSGKDRQILWGWVAEEGPAPHPGEDWSSIQSFPRVITLDPTNSSRLMYSPIPEVETLRGAGIMVSSTKVPAGSKVPIPSVSGNQLDIIINVTADFTSSSTAAGIEVFVDPNSKQGVPVTMAGTGPNTPEGIPLLTLNNGGRVGQSLIGENTNTVTLRVMVDRSVIEAYAADGRGVATHRVYPSAGQTGVQFVNTGKTDVMVSMVAYPMAVANPPSLQELME